MEMNFRTEQFDFDKEFANSQATMKKPNILICGATDVEKRSLLNDIFGKNVAVVSEGVPVTRGVQRYASDELDVVLYDSEGYEIGNEKLAYFRDNIKSIKIILLTRKFTRTQEKYSLPQFTEGVRK